MSNTDQLIASCMNESMKNDTLIPFEEHLRSLMKAMAVTVEKVVISLPCWKSISGTNPSLLKK